MTKEKAEHCQKIKEQLVQLHLAGKPRAEFTKEYNLTPYVFGF